MQLRRAAVYLLAAEIGENPLLVSRVFRYQALHIIYGVGHTLGVGVVEGKAHAKNVAAHERLPSIGFQAGGVLIGTGMEEEGRDLGDRASIQGKRMYKS